MTIKLSILNFYNRIFGVYQTFRYILIVMGGFVVAYSIAGVLGTILQCMPMSSLWLPGGSPFRCIHFSMLILPIGILNVITDITILCLPVALVCRLQISKPRKWMVLATFSLGGL